MAGGKSGGKKTKRHIDSQKIALLHDTTLLRTLLLLLI